MDELGMDYPFHLGVTEAGDGEDGRIKSAIGTGALLDDGIGDTVRVSLTEDPVAEVPVCYALIKPYNDRLRQFPEPQAAATELRLSARSDHGLDASEGRNPYDYARRPTRLVDIAGTRLGAAYPVRVEVATQAALTPVAGLLDEIETLARPTRKEQPAGEIIQLRARQEGDIEACITAAQALRARGLAVPLAVKVFSTLPGLTRMLPYAAKLNITPEAYATQAEWQEQLGALIEAAKAAGRTIQWDVNPDAIPAFLSRPPGAAGDAGQEGSGAQSSSERNGAPTLEGLVHTALALAYLCQAHGFADYLLALEATQSIPAYRLLAALLAAEGFDPPFMLKTPHLAADDALLPASLTLGSLLCDGFGDAIEVVSDLPASDAVRLSYNILQGARRRISKTEFISCPSCGRTQFDLETTTQRIKAQTGHLSGVKIAIMGCIVNGPGEMADADFGYVGAGPGKINLYVGKECIERNIPFALADHKLIELIKGHGKWVDPT
jgi:(E)-4-hydroxy-3-methylbut-2-enyl-diphosphate synthase